VKVEMTQLVDVKNAKEKIDRLIYEMEKTIYGKREVIQLTVTALLAGGHVLFEDIPGVGKTMMIKTLAKAIMGDFNRIQLTPDLFPGDILGVSIFNSQTNEFEFRRGPIFTTLLLADEINRTTPKTQSALLEAMSENHVTIDNKTYELDEHFFVLATQNPIEFEGTYPMPEAQLDRFLFRLKIGYPSFEDELNLMMDKKNHELIQVEHVISHEELTQLKQLVNQVYVGENVARYALSLVSVTRSHPQIELGISPRGCLAFLKAAQAFALTEGRDFVSPLDIQKVLPAAFRHRLLLSGNYSPTERQLNKIIAEIIAAVNVPIGR